MLAEGFEGAEVAFGVDQVGEAVACVLYGVEGFAGVAGVEYLAAHVAGDVSVGFSVDEDYGYLAVFDSFEC